MEGRKWMRRRGRGRRTRRARGGGARPRRRLALCRLCCAGDGRGEDDGSAAAAAASISLSTRPATRPRPQAHNAEQPTGHCLSSSATWLRLLTSRSTIISFWFWPNLTLNFIIVISVSKSAFKWIHKKGDILISNGIIATVQLNFH